LKIPFAIFIFLISNLSLALPGMSEKLLNYSLEESLVSSSAKNCVKEVNKSKVYDLLKSVGDINCNSKVSPDDFCKCIEIVSPDGLELSRVEKKQVEEMLDKVLTEFVYDQMKNKIVNINSFKEVKDILSSTNYKSNCFVSEKGSLLDNALSSKGNHEKGSNEYFRRKLISDIKNDFLPNSKVDDDLLKNLGAYISSHANNFTGTYGKYSNTFNTFNWSAFNDGGILTLISNRPDRDDIVKEILSIEAKVSKSIVLPGALFIPNVFQISSMVRKAKDKDYDFLNNEVNKGAYDIGVKLVKESCDYINNEIDKILAIDLNDTVESIKYSILNPLDKEDFKQIALVEELLSRQVSDDYLSDEISLSQHKELFNVDKLYCLDRKKLKDLHKETLTLTNLDNALIGLESIKNDLKNSLRNMQNSQSDLSDISRQSDQQKEKVNQLSLKIEIYNELRSGKYDFDLNGNTFINIKDKDILKKIESCKDAFCYALKHDPSIDRIPLDQIDMYLEGIYPEVLKSELILEEKILSEIQEREIQIKAVYNEHKISYNNSKKEEIEFLSNLREKHGEMAVRQVVSSVDKKLKISSYSTLVDNKSRKRSIKINGKELVKNVVSATLSNKNDQKIKSSKVDVSEDVKPSLSKVSNALSSNSMNEKREVRKLSSYSYNKNKNYVQTTPVNKEKIKTNNIKELEDRLASLKSSLNEKNFPKKGAELSESEKIAELNQKIEIQKLLNEKNQISQKINELKTSKGSTVNSPSVVTNNSSISSSINNATVKQNRRPSSINNVSKRTGANFNRNSSASNQASIAATRSNSYVADSESAMNTSLQSANNDKQVSRKKKINSNQSISLSNSSLESGVKFSSHIPDGKSIESRIVRLDFKLDDLQQSERNEVLKQLFLEGETTLILELPNGEKLFVENLENEKIEENQKIPLKQEKKDRMKYKDLKKYLEIGSVDDY
jgi:hypothetical protein